MRKRGSYRIRFRFSIGFTDSHSHTTKVTQSIIHPLIGRPALLGENRLNNRARAYLHWLCWLVETHREMRPRSRFGWICWYSLLSMPYCFPPPNSILTISFHHEQRRIG